MSFSHLTSGERKRLQQGILTPQQATLISARAEAKNPQGFWSTTWGQVIRGVGIAALNFIPGVGGVASTAVGAYDQARAKNLQAAANARYSSALAANAPKPAAPSYPFLETSPYPWLPDYGGIGGTPGYAGGVINPTMRTAQSGREPGFVEEIQAALGGWEPYKWWLLAGAGLLFLLIMMRGGR
jgi:hypothetical protein